jgi:isoleucyl-tRNA synthetase
MVASNDGESVALDLALSPELIAAGHIREVIRAIQERRKSDGFDISDRIAVEWNALPEYVSTISQGQEHISREVLATSFSLQPGLATGDNEIGLIFTIAKA